MRAELDGDLDRTLATMVEDPHLLNLPPGTGGLGAEGVRAFDANDLIGQFFPPMPCSFPSPARSMANCSITAARPMRIAPAGPRSVMSSASDQIASKADASPASKRLPAA